MDLHDFGMSRIAVADRAIGWVCHRSAGIAGFHALHAFHFIENSLKTPETAASQCCSLKIGIHMITPFLKFLTLDRQHEGGIRKYYSFKVFAASKSVVWI